MMKSLAHTQVRKGSSGTVNGYKLKEPGGSKWVYGEVRRIVEKVDLHSLRRCCLVVAASTLRQLTR